MKFRIKLLIGYIIAAILLTTVLAGFFFQYGENKVRHSFYQQLLIQVELVAENLAKVQVLESNPETSNAVRQNSRIAHARVTLLASDGSVIADSAYDFGKMSNHAGRPEVRAALRGKLRYAVRYSRTTKHNLIYVAQPLMRQNRIVGVVRLARDQAELDRTLVGLRWIIFGGVLIILMFPLGLGVALLTQMTRPILDMQRMAQQISQGDLTARVRIFGNDELADLGLVFNSMAQQLDESFHTIRSEKQKLEVILENMADGILMIDRELKIGLANRSAQEILGIDARLVQGRPILEGILNHHLLELIQEVNRYRSVQESELFLHFPLNRQLHVFLAPLQDQKGVLFGSIVVLHDLTPLRRLERVRRDFVANVSHELRTPVTSIKAMTETLLGGAWRDGEVFLRYLEAIDGESDRMTHLINDLLILARLDANQVVSKQAVDLLSLILEVKERFGPVKGRTPKLEVTPPSTSLPFVFANRDQLRQVVINLLENAFKYTPTDGQIRLSCMQEGDWVKVAVADTGIGIPRDDLSRIFERFYRVDKARSREIGGTGLGLSIVKNIVESHGGRVEVESVPNRGSVFSFTMPVYHE